MLKTMTVTAPIIPISVRYYSDLHCAITIQWECSIYHAKSFMFYNVRKTYRTLINKIELLNKMLLHYVTPNSNMHLLG